MNNPPKPEISKDFTMEDIRKIRDWNSARHMNMTHEEIIADTKKGADRFLAQMEERKKAKAKGADV